MVNSEPAPGPGCSQLVWGVGVAGVEGVVGSGSAPFLWGPRIKGPIQPVQPQLLRCLGGCPQERDCGTLGRASQQPLPVAWPTVGGGGTGRNESGKGKWKEYSKQREEAEQRSRDKRDETCLISCSKVTVAGR